MALCSFKAWISRLIFQHGSRVHIVKSICRTLLNDLICSCAFSLTCLRNTEKWMPVQSGKKGFRSYTSWPSLPLLFWSIIILLYCSLSSLVLSLLFGSSLCGTCSYAPCPRLFSHFMELYRCGSSYLQHSIQSNSESAFWWVIDLCDWRLTGNVLYLNTWHWSLLRKLTLKPNLTRPCTLNESRFKETCFSISAINQFVNFSFKKQKCLVWFNL